MIEFDPISEERQRLRDEIIHTINCICSSDPLTCIYGFCKDRKSCAAKSFDKIIVTTKMKHLTGLLKNAKKKLNRKLRKNDPVPHPNDLFGRLKYILGQDIFEHDLVKGDVLVKERIKYAKNLKQVLLILEEKYNAINSKPISLSKGRWQYIKYLGENHPEWRE